MDSHKQAAGRNWLHESRRRKPVRLDPAAEPSGEPLAPSSVWYSLGDLSRAPGRNWARKPRRRSAGRLAAPSGAPSVESYPPRERGGGDHDEKYSYRAPSARWTFPFTERQYARLLLLRSRVRDNGGEAA